MGEEGRGKLRKAAGIGTHEVIRRYLNGATRHVEDMSPSNGSKPGELKHLSTRRKRNRRDSVSSGERTRKSPNQSCYGNIGVVGPRHLMLRELEQFGKTGQRR